MRHQKLRSEKNCLNCGHMVEERFCSRCGQENQVIHYSAVHMILHYVQDLFHYDGRFWHTIRNLVLKPGHVPMEYIEGRRKRNIEPVKFYVFTSSVFFLLLFFRVGQIELSGKAGPTDIYHQRLSDLEKEKKYIEGTPDTLLINQLQQAIYSKVDSILLAGGDTISSGSQIGDVEIELFDGEKIDTSREPGFGGWLEYRLNEKAKKLEKEHGGDEVKAMTAILDELFHKLPQLLFLSMPFFALCLQLLYINRRNKKYVDHFIFSTYQYSYLFVLLIFYVLLTWVTEKMEGQYIEFIRFWLGALTLSYTTAYLFLSMKRFYGGRWLPLMLRFVTLAFLFVLVIFILFFAVALITFLW